MKKQGLGKGLSALLGVSDETKVPLLKEKEKNNTVEYSRNSEKMFDSNAEYRYIPTKDIIPNPYQPRKDFDDTSIDELAQAISRSGFITPIIVNYTEGIYTLVAGERRLRACKKLGLAEIPAIIKNFDDTQMMQVAIIENVQRKNLNPIEEAKAYHQMQQKFNLSPEEIGHSMGLPHYYIAQKLKLVRLPEAVQSYVVSGELSEGGALALLKLDSEDAMITAAKIAVRQRMTRVSIEKLVEKILLSKGIQPKSHDFYFKTKYQYMIDAFRDNLGWNMKLKNLQNGKGKLEIEFGDELDLKDIYSKLEKVLK